MEIERGWKALLNYSIQFRSNDRISQVNDYSSSKGLQSKALISIADVVPLTNYTYIAVLSKLGGMEMPEI
jgi:hypothetical protein